MLVVIGGGLLLRWLTSSGADASAASAVAAVDGSGAAGDSGGARAAGGDAAEQADADAPTTTDSDDQVTDTGAEQTATFDDAARAALPVELVGVGTTRRALESVETLLLPESDPVSVLVRPDRCRGPWNAAYESQTQLAGSVRVTAEYGTGKAAVGVSLTDADPGVSGDIVSALRDFQEECPTYEESYTGTSWLTRSFTPNGITSVAGWPAVLRDSATTEPGRDTTFAMYVAVDVDGVLVRVANAQRDRLPADELVAVAAQVVASYADESGIGS